MSQTTTWTPDRGSTTRRNPSTGHEQGAGSGKRLYTGHYSTFDSKGYLRFALDWTGVGKIVSAVLTLYTDDGNGELGDTIGNPSAPPRIGVRRLTSTFSEHTDSAIFTDADWTGPSATTSGQVANNGISKVPLAANNTDITDIVEAWAPATVKRRNGSAGGKATNYGILIYGPVDPAYNAGFISEDAESGVAAFKPYITLTYELGATAPDVPTTLTPSGSITSLTTFEGDFTDAKPGDTLRFSEVEVYTDAAFNSGQTVTGGTRLYARKQAESNAATIAARFSHDPSGLVLIAGATYKWRARVYDQESQVSLWTDLVSFTIINTAPSAPTLSPVNASSFATLDGVLFRGGTFADSDVGDVLGSYQVQLSAYPEGDEHWTDDAFILWNTGRRFTSAGATDWKTPYGGQALVAGTYYWRARQWDQRAGASAWTYASIILTADFDGTPGGSTTIQQRPKAKWRIRIRDIADQVVPPIEYIQSADFTESVVACDSGLLSAVGSSGVTNSLGSAWGGIDSFNPGMSPTAGASVVIAMWGGRRTDTDLGELDTIDCGGGYTEQWSNRDGWGSGWGSGSILGYAAIGPGGSVPTMSISFEPTWAGGGGNTKSIGIRVPTTATAPRQTGHGNGGTVVLGAAPVQGNLLVASLFIEGGLGTPSGWTEVASTTLSIGSGDTKLGLYVRCVGAGESATVTLLDDSHSHWWTVAEWPITQESGYAFDDDLDPGNTLFAWAVKKGSDPGPGLIPGFTSIAAARVQPTGSPAYGRMYYHKVEVGEETGFTATVPTDVTLDIMEWSGVYSGYKRVSSAHASTTKFRAGGIMSVPPGVPLVALAAGVIGQSDSPSLSVNPNYSTTQELVDRWPSGHPLTWIGYRYAANWNNGKATVGGDINHAARYGGVTVGITSKSVNRGPNKVVAIIEDAVGVGASKMYNSPGELHFTVPVDHPQISVIEPKQVHYAVDFYRGGGWQEVFAGLVWDYDATETEVIFYGIDYLALFDQVLDERFDAGNINKPTTQGGSKYSGSIHDVVSAALTYAITKPNSPVGFITKGTIGTMNEQVTIWSTFEGTLSFVTGLIDSHRQGTGKKTRISVFLDTNDQYTVKVEDDPGVTRDNLRLKYGELVQGYRVVPFGNAWASRMNVIGRARDGLKVRYQTASAPGIDQATWGAIAQAVTLDGIDDDNDLLRRMKQLAIHAGKLGHSVALGIRTGLLGPLDGYDITDSIPVHIVHGAVNTTNFGSGYWDLFGLLWSVGDKQEQTINMTLFPREDTSSPSDDLIDSVESHTQDEWGIDYVPPDGSSGGPKFIFDVATGIIYERDESDADDADSNDINSEEDDVDDPE